MEAKQPQTTHHNHYVPRFYLKQWSTNGHSFFVYDTVVSRESVKPWAKKAIAYSACWEDFYTAVIDGRDVDAFERIMASEFEGPAEPVFRKIRNGEDASNEEMAVLVNFLVAQLVRTPAWYLNIGRIFEENFEPTFQEVIAEVVRQYDEGTLTKEPPSLVEPFGHSMKVSISDEEDGTAISVSAYYGRKPYLNSALRNLYGTIGNHLRSLNWRVLDIPKGYELYASDNPVAIIAFKNKEMAVGPEIGMGNRVVIMMPLNPNKALFTQVGMSREWIDTLVLNEEHYAQLREATIKNATRYLYAKKPDDFVMSVRERVIDSEYYETMNRAREQWPEDQREIELDYERSIPRRTSA